MKKKKVKMGRPKNPKATVTHRVTITKEEEKELKIHKKNYGGSVAGAAAFYMRKGLEKYR